MKEICKWCRNELKIFKQTDRYDVAVCDNPHCSRYRNPIILKKPMLLAEEQIQAERAKPSKEYENGEEIAEDLRRMRKAFFTKKNDPEVL